MRLARRVVHPMHVSRGAVLDYPMPTTLRQLDAIIWSPFPAPAVFEASDFALVPRSSAFGTLEIKRSGYAGVAKALKIFLAAVPNIVAAPQPKISGDSRLAGMGVLGVMEGSASGALAKLLSDENVVAIFSVTKGKASVRTKDVLRLVNFLHFVSWRYRMQAAQAGYPQLVVN